MKEKLVYSFNDYKVYFKSDCEKVCESGKNKGESEGVNIVFTLTKKGEIVGKYEFLFWVDCEVGCEDLTFDEVGELCGYDDIVDSNFSGKELSGFLVIKEIMRFCEKNNGRCEKVK